MVGERCGSEPACLGRAILERGQGLGVRERSRLGGGRTGEQGERDRQRDHGVKTSLTSVAAKPGSRPPPGT